MNDLIKRQDAVDAIRKAVTKECAEWAVSELPSAQPEPFSIVNFQFDEDELRKIAKECEIVECEIVQDWIPCSERLPEEDKEVLVTRHFLGWNDQIPPSTYVEIARLIDGCWVSDSDELKIAPGKHTDPVAWMPLPEPYQYPLDIRDCDHCKHYVTRDGQIGCEKWECEFERRQ